MNQRILERGHGHTSYMEYQNKILLGCKSLENTLLAWAHLFLVTNTGTKSQVEFVDRFLKSKLAVFMVIISVLSAFRTKVPLVLFNMKKGYLFDKF